jgi:hypothetical protein
LKKQFKYNKLAKFNPPKKRKINRIYTPEKKSQFLSQKSRLPQEPILLPLNETAPWSFNGEAGH